MVPDRDIERALVVVAPGRRRLLIGRMIPQVRPERVLTWTPEWSWRRVTAPRQPRRRSARLHPGL
jgi:hypothetical protein